MILQTVPISCDKTADRAVFVCSTSVLSPVRLFLVLISFTGMSLCMLSPTVHTQCHQRCVGHELLSLITPSSSTLFAVNVVCPSHAPLSFVPSGVVGAAHHQRTTQQASRCLSPICSPTVPLSFKSCVPLSLAGFISAWQPLHCWRCSPIKPTTISSRVIPQRPLFVKAPHAPISFSVLWWRCSCLFPCFVLSRCSLLLATQLPHTKCRACLKCFAQSACSLAAQCIGCLFQCLNVHWFSALFTTHEHLISSAISVACLAQCMCSFTTAVSCLLCAHVLCFLAPGGLPTQCQVTWLQGVLVWSATLIVQTCLTQFPHTADEHALMRAP